MFITSAFLWLPFFPPCTLEEMAVLHPHPAGLAFAPGELISTEDHNPSL